jgi:hypothetical protein
MTSDTNDPTRTLVWPHGRAELQRLGAMLAPVVFSAAGHADLSPMQVAPWADEPGGEALPGVLRRLRGDWPCVPFGATECPPDMPAGWQVREAGDAWGHGYGANHEWAWLPQTDPALLALAVTTPDGTRLTRSVRAVPDAPALELELRVEVSEPRRWPIALHPTVRLDAGRAVLDVPHTGAGLTYPVPANPVVSLLAPNRSFDRLNAVPRADGSVADLTHYPQPIDSEELLQLQDISGPVTLHYVDAGWALVLDWDRTLLPDMMLWVSHRGRRHAPWNGRHWALGLEPVNGAFDLGRVATPPADHPLAAHPGIALQPGVPWVLRYRLSAQPARP